MASRWLPPSEGVPPPTAASSPPPYPAQGTRQKVLVVTIVGQVAADVYTRRILGLVLCLPCAVVVGLSTVCLPGGNLKQRD